MEQKTSRARATDGGGGQLGPCREKYWHEKTDAEKVALLGDVVERLTHKVAELEAAQELFREHRHGEGDGKILVELKRKEEHFGRAGRYFNPLGREHALGR